MFFKVWNWIWIWIWEAGGGGKEREEGEFFLFVSVVGGGVLSIDDEWIKWIRKKRGRASFDMRFSFVLDSSLLSARSSDVQSLHPPPLRDWTSEIRF